MCCLQSWQGGQTSSHLSRNPVSKLGLPVSVFVFLQASDAVFIDIPGCKSQSFTNFIGDTFYKCHGLTLKQVVDLQTICFFLGLTLWILLYTNLGNHSNLGNPSLGAHSRETRSRVDHCLPVAVRLAQSYKKGEHRLKCTDLDSLKVESHVLKCPGSNFHH